MTPPIRWKERLGGITEEETGMNEEKRFVRIAQHNAARDKALMGSLADFVAWTRTKDTLPFAVEDEAWQPFTNRHAAEMAYHKMRTACVMLPNKIRRASHGWSAACGRSTGRRRSNDPCRC
jgi:hypothetical protein